MTEKRRKEEVEGALIQVRERLHDALNAVQMVLGWMELEDHVKATRDLKELHHRIQHLGEAISLLEAAALELLEE